jgi:hypothetical protein
MGRWLFLPDSVLEELVILSRASVDRLAKLRLLLDSEESLRSSAVSLRVGEILGVSDQEAAGVFSFWEYVQQERTENEKTGKETLDEFLRLLKSKQNTADSPEALEFVRDTNHSIQVKRDALEALFEECPSRDYARKARLLESGPLPHLARVRTFCDLRPIYNAEGTEIIDHVALITMRLGIHNSYSDENKEVLINLRELDLKRIEEELQRTRTKLAVLKKRFDLKTETKLKKSRGK